MFGARCLFVIVEEIVDELLLWPNGVVFFCWVVFCVSHVFGGVKFLYV